MGQDAIRPVGARLYRVVENPGLPHPCLDGVYDSLEAALGDLESWRQGCAGVIGASCMLGVEVNTRRGEWRTLRLLPCPAGFPGGLSQPPCCRVLGTARERPD